MSDSFWRWLARRPQAGGRRHRQQARRPGLEWLESRDLPSVFHTQLISFRPNGGNGPLTSPGPTGTTPAQIRHAYGIDQITFQGGTVAGNGSGTTIAIVDAYDDPNIANDLHQFDLAFGLPDPPSFTKMNENGGSTMPSANSGWITEIALDVEWSHAIAPGASILLVEANSSGSGDLYLADRTAARQPGVVVVSNSWGGNEYGGEAGADATFTTPSGHQGVTFLFSSGDSGAPASYPSASPNVLSVGGTTLSLDSAGNIRSETAWGNSHGSGGGGVSAYESQPGYQAGLVIANGSGTVNANGKRATPDVAWDADPATGFGVYDSYNNGTVTPWGQWGGTSDAAPQWAGLIAIIDQGRLLGGAGPLDGPGQTLPYLYALPAADFHDVTGGGSTGTPAYSAGPGYDLVTGRGSPLANLIVSALVPPQIRVNVGTTVVPDGGSLAFANTTAGTPVTQTLTVTNTGYAPLVLGTAVDLPAGFSVAQGFGATTLAPNASTALVLQMNASAVGQYAGPASFATNAPADPNFTITLSGSAYPVPTATSLPYSDAFNRSDSFYLGGPWAQPVGGIAVAGQQAVSQTAGASVAVLSGVSAADVTVQATVSATATAAPGLVARYSGPGDSNMYAAFLVGGSQPTAQIWRSAGGTWTLLASAPVSASSGTLRFDVQGTSLAVSFNGALAAQVQDGTIAAAGSVGFRGYNAGAAWANLSAAAITLAPATLPFIDNFSRANSATLVVPWVTQAGAIGVSSQQAVPQAAGASVAVLSGVSAADVTVQATVSATASSAPGLVARYSGPGDGNMYAAFLVGGSQPTVTIWRSAGGTWTLLASAPVSASLGTLTFTVQGTALSLSLNGALVAQAQDSTITAAGSVGLRGYNAGAAWSNFSASTAAAPTLPYNDGFNRADGPALGSPWLTQAGAIGVSGQQAVAQAAGASVATLAGISAADVSVQATVIAGSGVAAGLVARYSGPGDSNMYAAFLVGGAQPSAQIWRSVGGTWTMLTSAPVSGSAGTLRFDVQGSALALYFNGALATSATDGSITAAGSVGLRGYGAGAAWDDFAANALS